MTQREVVRIPVVDDQDPLVVSWLTERRQDCAWHTCSPIAVPIAVVGSALVGALVHDLWAPDSAAAGLPWFVTRFMADPRFFLGGMIAYLLLVLLWQQWGKPSGISAAPEYCAGSALTLVAYLTLYDPLIALGLVTTVVCLTYSCVCAMRIAAVVAGRVPEIEADCSRPMHLPIYTVLVPLYREAAIAGQIVDHMNRLDYPHDRLDVKFLLEADDDDTQAAFAALDLPDWAEVVVVPDAQPKTKPRACNHGLARARGDYLVIFDAEDRPDPDQLRKAVAAFGRLPDVVACVQAHLAYHNHEQNLLTQLFAQEYNAWFRHYLPGLCRFGSPIPLGGTSNHFRVEALRAAGGWDPFNVTEDCDLGLRLAVSGSQVAILPSTTWEEANSRVGNWIRQRSRWIKGYMQTFLVWGRRPGRLLARLGAWRALWFMATVASVPLFALLNPLLWVVLGYYLLALALDVGNGYGLWELLASRPDVHDRWSWPMLYFGIGENPLWQFLSIVFFVFSVGLLASNVVFAWLHLHCGRRPGQRFSLLRTGCAIPWYWVLMSIAGWKAFWQLLTRPHYWEKTIHGLDRDTAVTGCDAGEAGGP